MIAGAHNEVEECSSTSLSAPDDSCQGINSGEFGIETTRYCFRSVGTFPD